MQRLHYLHTTAYYLLAIVQCFFWLAPVLYLLWRLPIMTPLDGQELLVHAGPYFTSIAFLFAVYLGPVPAFRTFSQ